MKKLVMLSLVGALALVLAQIGVSSACPIEIPTVGTINYVVTDDGNQWTDNDGILHIRGMRLDWEFVEGPFTGTGWGIVRADIDVATGNGTSRSYNVFDVTFQGDSGILRGFTVGDYTGWVLTADAFYMGTRGLRGIIAKNTTTLVQGSGVAYYDGYVYDYRGDDDKSAAETETQTWSSVKSMYR
jgi:hypothetical protein